MDASFFNAASALLLLVMVGALLFKVLFDRKRLFDGDKDSDGGSDGLGVDRYDFSQDGEGGDGGDDGDGGDGGDGVNRGD